MFEKAARQFELEMYQGLAGFLYSRMALSVISFLSFFGASYFGDGVENISAARLINKGNASSTAVF